MLRSKQKRTSLERLRRGHLPTLRNESSTQWDIWLPRLSHFAQFGLFLFTVGSLYFTVIPLYQKAVLEEAIAKREIELKVLNDRLAIAYDRLRSYAVRDFQMQATPVCVGLYSPPRAANVQNAKESAKSPRAEIVFSVDIRQCLLKVADETPSLKDLSAIDRNQFDEELGRVIARIEGKRDVARSAYRMVPAELGDAEAVGLPTDSFRVRHLEIMARLRGPEAVQSERRKLAAEIMREKIGSEYERSILEELLTLRKVEWRSEAR